MFSEPGAVSTGTDAVRSVVSCCQTWGAQGCYVNTVMLKAVLAVVLDWHFDTVSMP